MCKRASVERAMPSGPIVNNHRDRMLCSIHAEIVAQRFAGIIDIRNPGK